MAIQDNISQEGFEEESVEQEGAASLSQVNVVRNVGISGWIQVAAPPNTAYTGSGAQIVTS